MDIYFFHRHRSRKPLSTSVFSRHTLKIQVFNIIGKISDKLRIKGTLFPGSIPMMDVICAVETVYQLPDGAPCPVVQKRKVCNSEKTLFSCLIMHLLILQGLITTEYLASVFARRGKSIQWPACSLDLNPLENLWSILKRKIYFCGRQYTFKNTL